MKMQKASKSSYLIQNSSSGSTCRNVSIQTHPKGSTCRNEVRTRGVKMSEMGGQNAPDFTPKGVNMPKQNYFQRGQHTETWLVPEGST